MLAAVGRAVIYSILAIGDSHFAKARAVTSVKTGKIWASARPKFLSTRQEAF